MPLTGFLRTWSRHRSHRLAFRLLLWVLAAGLPSMAVGAVLVGVLYHTTILSAERSAELAARQAMDTLDRLMFERYGDAEIFASLPSVRTLEREQLQDVANLHVSTYAPYYALAVAADRTGRILAVGRSDFLTETRVQDRLLQVSVAGESWFQEAMALGQQTVVYEGARNLLAETLTHHATPAIVFARAIHDGKGQVVGVWSAHILIDSLVHVFQHMQGGVEETLPYPIVLKTAAGERLLTIGDSANASPVATVPSMGFSRWPGGRWVLEVYMPGQITRRQWGLLGLGGAVIMLFAATGTAVLALVLKRQLVQPLADLEAQVLLFEAPALHMPAEVAVQGEAAAGNAASAQALLLRRDDELGDIARLLHAQTEEIHLHVRQLAMLNESSRGIQEHVVSLPALLERILHTAKTLTGARYAALGVLDESGERLVQFLAQGEGIDEETKRAIGALPTGRGLLGAVIKTEGGLRLGDLSQHPDSAGFPAHHPAMRSFLGISIRARGRLFGRLYLTDKLCTQAEDSSEPVAGEFTALDEQLISVLAFQAGTAIETASLIEEIRATQCRDRAILDSVEEGIYGVDLTGRCLFINRAGAKLLGYAQNHLVGRDIHAAIHHTREDGTPCPETECPLVASLRTHRGCRLEQERLWRQDGTSFPAMCAATLLRDEFGTVTGAVVTFSDLTERRALETQIRQGQKLETLGQLAAGVAHDFNNLLTIMAGYSDLALHQADIPSSVRTKIEEIKKATDRAAVLTGQLLAFGRKKPVERKVVNVNQAILGIDSLVHHLIGDGIVLDIQLPDGPWFIRVDPGGFEQVLINLVVNARDAMPNGGRLNIRGAVPDRPPAMPAQALGGPSVMITVSDTGVGMDKATQARIFEPFFTTKSVGQGTGLGLATVYRIVMENEGGIYVDSVPGAGTTFTVVFPLVQPPAGQPATAAGAPQIRGGDETVLLVEDDVSVRALATSILESRGYRVLTAHDGHDGLKIARQYDGIIHLLVSDVRLPYLSGPSMARRLSEERPDLKILFITGSIEAGMRQDRTQPIHHHVLSKPFTAQALSEAVRRVLDEETGQRGFLRAKDEPPSILIIDDDHQVNSLLQAMLAGEPYRVLAAPGGAEGIQLLQKEHVDILLLDMLMPEMDGVMVIEEVRRRWPSLKILAMSGGGIGTTPEFYLTLARQLGAVETLAKPFSRDQLLQEVREILG